MSEVIDLTEENDNQEEGSRVYGHHPGQFRHGPATRSQTDTNDDDEEVTIVGTTPGLQLPSRPYTRGNDRSPSVTGPLVHPLQDQPFSRHVAPIAGPSNLRLLHDERPLAVRSGTRTPPVPGSSRLPNLPRPAPRPRIYVQPPNPPRTYAPGRRGPHYRPNTNGWTSDSTTSSSDQSELATRVVAARGVPPAQRPNQAAAGGAYRGVGIEELRRNAGFDFGRIMDQFEYWLPGIGRIRTNNPEDAFARIHAAYDPMAHQMTRKLKNKRYSIKNSHPGVQKRTLGFNRDVAPPPEVDEDALRQEQETEAAVAESLAEQAKSSQEESRRVTDPQQDSSAPLSRPGESASAISAPANTDVPELELDAESHSAPTTLSISSGDSVNASTSEDGPSSATSIESIPEQPPLRTRKILAPVCTSCLLPLWLNQSSQGRPYLLRCMHVVCFSCLTQAQDRAKVFIHEAEADGLLVEDLEEVDEYTAGMPGGWKAGGKTRGAAKGKGKKAGANGARKRKLALQSEAEEAATLSKKARADPAPERQEYSKTGRPLRRAAAANRYLAESPPPPPDIPVPIDSATPVVDVAPEAEVEVAQASESKSSEKGKGKAPPKKVEQGPEVDSEWRTCPIIGCTGTKTDVTAKLGSRDGAWEMFV